MASISSENTVSTSGPPDDTVGRPVFDYEEYHPFGSTSWHARDSAIEVSAKRYRYTGKEKDDETGLIYIGARYYAGWLGRWTSSDPIGTGGGINRYSYVRNRPVSKYDPTGHADADTLAQQAANRPADGGMCYPPEYGGGGGAAMPSGQFNEAAGALRYVNDPKAVARETGPQAFADRGGGYPAPFMDPASVATRMITSEVGPFGLAGATAGYAAATATGGDQMVGMGVGAAVGGLYDPVAIARGQGGTNRDIASGPAQRTQTRPVPETAPRVNNETRRITTASPAMPPREAISKYNTGSGFTGVSDVVSREMELQPSEGATLKSGAPVDTVPRRGGHVMVENELRNNLGGSGKKLDVALTVGYFVQLDPAGRLSISWTSFGVNARNFQDNPEAPVVFRRGIMQDTANLTGVDVIDPNGILADGSIGPVLVSPQKPK